MLLRIELEDDEELVQGVAGAFAVRGRVDGAAVGAVGGDFKFVLGVFVSGSLLAVYSSFSPVDERQETAGRGVKQKGRTVPAIPRRSRRRRISLTMWRGCARLGGWMGSGARSVRLGSVELEC